LTAPFAVTAPFDPGATLLARLSALLMPPSSAFPTSVPYLKGGTLRASLTMSTYLLAMRRRTMPTRPRRASGVNPALASPSMGVMRGMVLM